jgi:hypothetical protein
MGFTHPDDLKVIFDAAKELNIDPVDAAEKKYVKAEIEAQQEVRKSKDATPAPRRSGSSGNNDIGALADKVAKGEALPTDPALSEKVQQELARRAQASS